MSDEKSPVGEPPEYMTPRGRELWAQIVMELGDQLLPIDRAALELTCATFSAAQYALEDLNVRGILVKGRSKDHSADTDGEEGEGEPYMVKNPAEQIARQMSTQFFLCAKEFGMTPASRKRMQMELKKIAKLGPQPEID